MATTDRKITAEEFLREFYGVRGIGDSNLREKLRAMKEHAIIPNFPRGKTPTLYELETMYLRDHGYNF